MKTADWYTPHTFEIAQDFDTEEVRVVEMNGAGQTTRTTTTFENFQKASEWIKDTEIAQAKAMGALIEE